MLATEFFPTPTSVIRRMLSSFVETRTVSDRVREFFSFKGKTILDPNGGSGSILDYLQELHRIDKSKLFTIEIDNDLRFTLQGKGYRVIGTDFLQYDEPCTFDMILMNPPFSEGVKHVLKAFNILADGGHLVALLNAQTIKNPYTQEREYLVHLLASMLGKNFNADKDCLEDLLEELENEGYLEWLGSCFKDAERPTDVEVVLIRLNKPEKTSEDFFNDLNLDTDHENINDDFSPNTLAHRDAIANLVARYNAARKILIERHETQFKLDFYLNGISRPVFDSNESKKEESLLNEVPINEQLLILKSRFWNTVFTKTELGRRTTSDFQDKFNKFTLQQSYIAFTEDNVKDVLLMFVDNMNDLMKESLIKVFDEATAHHEDNRISEGWKTNKAWKLNKRIIVPYGVKFEWNEFHTNYYREKFYTDLDKILCWLDGKKYEEITPAYKAITDFCQIANKTGGYQQKFESTFFSIKMFKKGTIHLDFKDLELLADFNRVAAENKKWLGSDQPLN